MFRPEEVEAESKEYREDLKAEAAGEVYGDKEDKSLMDCYVYSCSECGGEIIVNGTEASTTCVYCGNPNVVFSRISKQKRPEYVMPFSITKERAIELVHKKIDHGIFIPRAIKKFTPDCVRGIYIPYWIVNAKFTDAVVIRG
jgi:DNA-directed RNA polymerase subunit RPC12/RpoP